MPEMRFRIRWPDGSTESCYSPSLVVKDFLSSVELSAGRFSRAQPCRARNRERAGQGEIRLGLLARGGAARAHRDGGEGIRGPA